MYCRALSDPLASVIVVAHRDRLTWFGFEHLQAALEDPETSDEARDVIEILASLCAACMAGGWRLGRAAKAVAVVTSGP